MGTPTVTAKGQITLRKEMLKHLGVQPGDRIVLDKLPDGRVLMKAERPTGKFCDVYGLLEKKDAPSLSIEQINRISAQGWAGRR